MLLIQLFVYIDGAALEFLLVELTIVENVFCIKTVLSSLESMWSHQKQIVIDRQRDRRQTDIALLAPQEYYSKLNGSK